MMKARTVAGGRRRASGGASTFGVVRSFMLHSLPHPLRSSRSERLEAERQKGEAPVDVPSFGAAFGLHRMRAEEAPRLRARLAFRRFALPAADQRQDLVAQDGRL